jgi:adenine-specific DNA-methyltransferase
MTPKQKLELTWIGKENRPRLEPRILLEDPEKSYHAKRRVTENDIFDNRLIFGDNLLALKALEQEFAGKVRCVFIDPPYNTGNAFEHYDDGLEHSIWLSLIRDRIEIIRRLMSEDGSLWITIDDNEAHYLKVVCDEIFGRANYLTSIVWEKDKGRRSDTAISVSHDYILIYTKDLLSWSKTRNLLPRTAEQTSRYRNPDNDPRGVWLQGDNGTAKSASEGSRFPVTLPSGRVVVPPPGRGWSFSRDTLENARAENRVYFGANGDGMPIIKRYLSEVQDGVVPRTWWTADDAGHNQEAKRDHLNKLLVEIEPFPTPKPERLLERILQIASNEGDLILDSFAGSGTTGAVAQKMGRRWIMVELGGHASTHIIPRLRKVIDGEDPGGVTESTGWKGGGGFRYFHIAPSLLEKDRFGNLVISKQYNAAMLAEAMCKVMGFIYAPSDELYWQQGHSTESDFVYVTTQTLTREQLAKLSDEVGDHRSLLICCAAFRGKADAFPNLTVKKIPSAVLAKCEWGHDDYSLNVANLPKASPTAEFLASDSERALTPKQIRRRTAQPNLFPIDGNGGAE